jgi:hypothetical protein
MQLRDFIREVQWLDAEAQRELLPESYKHVYTMAYARIGDLLGELVADQDRWADSQLAGAASHPYRLLQQETATAEVKLCS